MKKFIPLFFITVLFSLDVSFGQENDEAAGNRPNHVKGGFYFKVGPVFSISDFHYGQTLSINNPNTTPHLYKLTYLPAKIGPALDMGFLIYLGPSFANNYLRAGIDATFFSFWFNSTSPVNSNERYKHYYYFVGQKFGPVISFNPVDLLVIDFSYKINANFGYHYDEWDDLQKAQYSDYGYNIWGQEVSLNIRYGIILLGFQYNFGKITYVGRIDDWHNFDSSHPDQVIQIDTYRILFGFKF